MFVITLKNPHLNWYMNSVISLRWIKNKRAQIIKVELHLRATCFQPPLIDSVVHILLDTWFCHPLWKPTASIMGAVKIINTQMWSRIQLILLTVKLAHPPINVWSLDRHRFQGCGLLALDTVLVFIFMSKPNLEQGLLWSKMGPPSDSCFSFENYITTTWEPVVCASSCPRVADNNALHKRSLGGVILIFPIVCEYRFQCFISIKTMTLDLVINKIRMIENELARLMQGREEIKMEWCRFLNSFFLMVNVILRPCFRLPAVKSQLQNIFKGVEVAPPL